MKRFFSSKLYVPILGLSALLLSTASPQTTYAAENKSTYEYLELFGDVFERVRRDYVEEVSDEKLIEAAISGMLQSLDPHSAYLDPDNYKDMRVDTRGEFGGLGIEVTMENGYVKVISPIDDTPAAEAGVQAGDLITHLDQQPVLGLSLAEAVEKMRGKVGTDITITIRRGPKEALDITLERAVIKIRSVRSHLEDNIGYLRITSFSEQTEDNLERAIKKLQSEANKSKKPLTGYVLDLRNNPGGLLDQAVAVSDSFLDKGEIVSTRSRNARETERYNAAKGDLISGKPLVVLINGGSASASEIVAGALQDHKRAVLMGTKSFGKGSVQTVIPLRGHGAMKLTSARYYTPSGRSIQAVGIEPDISVPAAKIEVLEPNHRFHEADFCNALDKSKNGNQQAKENVKSRDQLIKEAASKDYQLQRALDLLRGISLYSNTFSHKG